MFQVSKYIFIGVIYQRGNNLITITHFVSEIKSLFKIIPTIFRLEHLFVGVSDVEICAIKQFRLKALAIHLVFVVRASNASALAPCHHFLAAVEETERELSSKGLEPDPFTAAVFRELGALDEPKPGPVARCLLPLLQGDLLGKPPPPNINVSLK